MNIRNAIPEDLDTIMELYARAREFMVATGNPRQWASRNWPPRRLIEQDIAAGKCYVCHSEEGLLAVFFYDFGKNIDPCYNRIDDGSWANDGPYGVVHRIAAKAGSGAGKVCIQWAFDRCGHLRIDTHGDNRVMQHTLEKLGFARRGIIHVAEDNDPRIAYEKIQ